MGPLFRGFFFHITRISGEKAVNQWAHSFPTVVTTLLGPKENGPQTAAQNIVHVSTVADQRGGAAAIPNCLNKSAVRHSTFRVYFRIRDCKLIQKINGFGACIPHNIARLQQNRNGLKPMVPIIIWHGQNKRTIILMKNGSYTRLCFNSASCL